MRQPPNYSRIAVLLWLLITIAIALVVLMVASENERLVAARTIWLGICASLIALPLGSLIAWASRGQGLIPRVLFVCNIVLLFVPMFIHVSSWDAAFGKLGWLTSTKGQVLVPLVSGWTAATWIHGVAAAPYVALILTIGLNLGRRTFEEQALLDTDAAGVFWHITIRRICPLLVAAFVWIVISSAREIAVTDLYQIGTVAEQVYLGYSLGLSSIAGKWTADQLAEAGELNPVITIAVIGWLAVTAFWLFFRLTNFVHQSGTVESSRATKSTAKQNFAGALALILLVAIPVGNVLMRACFFVQPVDGTPTTGYSVTQLFHSVRRSCIDYQNEFVWSFLISLVSSTLILLLASVSAFAAQRSRVGQLVFVGALATCCALPGPYIGTLLAGLLSNVDNETIRWFYNYTIAAPVIANLIFCWPAGALVVWFVFRKIPEDAMESARVDGAGWVTRFTQFGVRANPISLLGCWLITFAFCFGELSASQIVRPAGIDTVPRKMLGDLHAGVNELTAGITILMAIAIVTISLTGWCFLQLNRRVIGR